MALVVRAAILRRRAEPFAAHIAPIRPPFTAIRTALRGRVRLQDAGIAVLVDQRPHGLYSEPMTGNPEHDVLLSILAASQARRESIQQVADALGRFAEELAEKLIPAVASFNSIAWLLMTPAQRRRAAKRMIREHVIAQRLARS